MPKVKRIPDLPEDLSNVVPVYAPDDRQEWFIDGAADRKDKIIANLQGCPASCPDLGLLQWMIHSAVNCSGMSARQAARAAIAACVQRIESISATARDACLKVKFVSVDDFGKYHYSFDVDLSKKSYPLPSTVIKLLDMQKREESS